MKLKFITISENKPHFITLDGLRGIAALMVVIYHWVSDYGLTLFSNSILAVDFFFMLSGFVVAYSYQNRLKSGLSFIHFMKLRLIRLYPLIFLGATLGVIRFIAKVFFSDEVDWLYILLQYGLNLIMFPNTLFGYADIFPMNGPLWSLFFELFAYLCFALFLFKLSSKFLIILTSLGSIGFIYWIYTLFGTYEHVQLMEGFQRICFSFPLGVLLYRLYCKRQFNSQSIFLFLLICAVLFLFIPTNIFPKWFYVIAFISIFPLLILFGTNYNSPQFLRSITQFMGQISYPVYVLHIPLLWVLRFIIYRLFGLTNESWGGDTVWLGLIVIPIVIGISYMLLKIYDEPLRKLLKAKYVNFIS